MRALVQRVSGACVRVGGETVGRIGRGYLVLLGVYNEDGAGEAEYLARRTADLRVFGDGNGKMNLGLRDVDGSVLVVSQFTLCADTRKGNRPSFAHAAAPDVAERLYGRYVETLRYMLGDQTIATGVFGAMMEVELCNDGPVTILLEASPASIARTSDMPGASPVRP